MSSSDRVFSRFVRPTAAIILGLAACTYGANGLMTNFGTKGRVFSLAERRCMSNRSESLTREASLAANQFNVTGQPEYETARLHAISEHDRFNSMIAASDRRLGLYGTYGLLGVAGIAGMVYGTKKLMGSLLSGRDGMPENRERYAH
jgi:hypothetical protein